MSLSKTTQDHEEIRQWAEARGAKPAAVASTKKDNSTGILRLEFPGKPHANDSALQEIDWDEFFEKFDASGLEFIYQDVTADGEQSNFNKLVYPENDKSHGKSTPAKKSSASHSDHAKDGSASAKKSTSKSASKSTGSSSNSHSPAKSTAKHATRK